MVSNCSVFQSYCHMILQLKEKHMSWALKCLAIGSITINLCFFLKPQDSSWVTLAIWPSIVFCEFYFFSASQIWVMRQTGTKITRVSHLVDIWAICKKSWIVRVTKTPIFPNCQMLNAYSCITIKFVLSLQIAQI